MLPLSSIDAFAHSCMNHSGVVVCDPSVKPHHDYSWMSKPVTQEEIDSVGVDQDLRECRLCHRRFLARCNFDEDFS